MDNIELFEEEIETIREFSELDMETFHEVLDCTRGVVNEMGNAISPAAVIDIIEGAVGNLVYNADEKPITVTEAVERTITNLHLLDEMEDMFEDEVNPNMVTDENDTGKIRQ